MKGRDFHAQDKVRPARINRTKGADGRRPPVRFSEIRAHGVDGIDDARRAAAPADQFNTKKWMITHADELMDESRRRQVEWTGASLAMANTVPPPADVVHSNAFYSEVNPTHYQNGIGVERAGAKAPPLFGTFMYEPTMSELQNNRKNIALTQYQEGGRNSVRGVFMM